MVERMMEKEGQISVSTSYYAMQWMNCTHGVEVKPSYSVERLVSEQEVSIYVSEPQEFHLLELPEDVNRTWADMRKNPLSHVLE